MSAIGRARSPWLVVVAVVMFTTGSLGALPAEPGLDLQVPSIAPVHGTDGGYGGQGKQIHAKGMDDHGCEPDEWHLVITHVDQDHPAPGHIHVAWQDGTEQRIELGRVTGRVAHYVTTAELDQPMTEATAVIDEGWRGQFNLSHGPCHPPGDGQDGEDGDGDGAGDGGGDDGGGTDDGSGGDGGTGDEPADDEEEPTSSCPDPEADDSDGDGLPDDLEAEIGTDPCHPDTDLDGLDDGLDVDLCTDPLVADTDGDDLLDGREVDLGLDPCDPDTDDGGLADGRELAVGTDPLDDTDDMRIDLAMEATYPATGPVTGQANVTLADGSPVPGNQVEVVAYHEILLDLPVPGPWDLRPTSAIYHTEATCTTNQAGTCTFELPPPILGGLDGPGLLHTPTTPGWEEHRWRALALTESPTGVGLTDEATYEVVLAP